jgi:methylated-DNA-[protein]-cysteine S-methyltransferase
MKFDTSIVQTSVPSPLGTITLAATGKGLAGLWFAENQRYLPTELAPTLVASRTALPPGGAVLAWGGLARRTSPWPCDPDHPVLQQAREQLSEYFAGQRSHFDVSLDLGCGTAFQQSVWQALLAIPHGEVVSYGEVSRRIGNPAAVRAVGGAIGRNPVSIIVPCHRVTGTDGALTGYGGGLDRKTALLQLEGALAESLL